MAQTQLPDAQLASLAASKLTGTSLPSGIVGSSLTSVGVISAGTWQGTVVGVAYGGTGRATSTTAYGLLAAGTTATGAHQTLSAGTAGQILQSGGASALPSWFTLAANVSTFLGTPSSANLLAAVTDETGTGALVFATAPTLNQPNLVGVTTNSTAAVGSVGEIITASLASGSAVSLTSGTTSNVVSISLTAGDWNITGMTALLPAATTTVTAISNAIHTASAAFPTDPDPSTATIRGASYTPVSTIRVPTGMKTLQLSATTTVYLVINATFATSTLSAFGILTARRIR